MIQLRKMRWRSVKRPGSLLSVVLACLLVAIQQFGFAHALSHLANPNPQRSTRGDPQHPAEKVCLECVAFAQIGTGLTGQVPVVADAAPRFIVVATPVRYHDPAFVPSFRSRAPPALA